jgi:hypothetical protein
MKDHNALLITFLMFFLQCSQASGQDAQATASVSSDTIGVQDQVQFSITVSGKDSGDAEAPRVLRTQGFRIVSGPNVGTQFQWINGRTSSSKSFSYILVPEKEGQFTIDSVEVRVGNKTCKTPPVQVRVTSASSNPRPSARSSPAFPYNPLEEENRPNQKPPGDTILVKTELDRASAYAGQQITLFYKIYTQVEISGIQLQESPPLSGFWVEDLEVEKSPRGARQAINGREYLVYTVKKQALFANTTGQLKIPSSTFAISANTGGDFFGMFGGTETLYRKTPELTLEVKPLPASGRPANFSNAVGAFNLTANLDKNQVETGGAVALRLKLEGRGNLKMIPDIPMPQLPDFTIYSSKHADNIRPFAQDQVGGDKTWEYVIVPKAPGRQTIPPFSFSYFDAATEKYETVSTPELALDVTSGTGGISSSPVLSEANKQELVRRGTDINFIKLAPGNFEAGEKPVYRKSWFYLIVFLPLLFNAGIFVYQLQKTRSESDAITVRMRKARRNALDRLRKAEKQAEPRRFYDLAAAAFSGYLADRFRMSEIELTEDNVELNLLKNSVPQEIIEETKACLRECDFGRFVSATRSREKTNTLSARIRKNIDHLEQGFTS